MNHDYTHCADYNPAICPVSCFRAQVTAVLEANRENIVGVPISWAHFIDTPECKRADMDQKPKVPESFWRLASAQFAHGKATYAVYQTGELGRKKTIISVDNDEALVIEWALRDYIEKHRKEYQ